MRYFNHKRRNFAYGQHLLGLLLIIAGFFDLASPLFFNIEGTIDRNLAVGIGAIILGVLIVASYGGTLIDIVGKRSKGYMSIGGFKFGKWQKAPAILRLEVISTSYLSTNKVNGISPTLSGRVTEFKILLYSDATYPMFSFVYSDRSKAVKEARSLATNLNVELVLNIS